MSKEDIKLNVGQEELSIKVPLIMEDEIRYIDNNMETIVDTITKQIISDKDLAIAQHIIQKLQQENEANKKRIEELEEENKIYKRQLNDAFDRGFIHKDKIKEIIQKLDVDIERNNRTKEAIKRDFEGRYVNYIIAYKPEIIKQILEELLKDGGE